MSCSSAARRCTTAVSSSLGTSAGAAASASARSRVRRRSNRVWQLRRRSSSDSARSASRVISFCAAASWARRSSCPSVTVRSTRGESGDESVWFWGGETRSAMTGGDEEQGDVAPDVVVLCLFFSTGSICV